MDRMDDVTLLNDVIFKIVFGKESNKRLLAALLNALLELRGPGRIDDLEILSSDAEKDDAEQKGVVMDLQAQDSAGRLYNIEVQVGNDPAFANRAVYYLARLFGSRGRKGKPYDELSKTIGIALLGFGLFKDVEDLQSTYCWYDPRHDRQLTDVLELHFIELTKFRKDKPGELQNPFEKWLHALKFSDLYMVDRPLPVELQEEEGIAMALDEMRNALADEKVRTYIEFRKKFIWDEEHRIATAEKKGRQEGREEGREEGRREVAIAFARRLRDKGMDTQTILDLTGLRPEDLPF